MGSVGSGLPSESRRRITRRSTRQSGRTAYDARLPVDRSDARSSCRGALSAQPLDSASIQRATAGLWRVARAEVPADLGGPCHHPRVVPVCSRVARQHHPAAAVSESWPAGVVARTTGAGSEAGPGPDAPVHRESGTPPSVHGCLDSTAHRTSPRPSPDEPVRHTPLLHIDPGTDVSRSDKSSRQGTRTRRRRSRPAPSTGGCRPAFSFGAAPHAARALAGSGPWTHRTVVTCRTHCGR